MYSKQTCSKIPVLCLFNSWGGPGASKSTTIPPAHGGKRRKSEKGGKGLRHFSKKVCEKVRRKGTTSYNEVADELVAEFTNPANCFSSSDQVNKY